MPNRMLRDWTDSDRINTISVHAERIFVRLIMKVDDHGCYYADARLLKPNLFPLQIDVIQELDVEKWIAELQESGLITLYTAKGKRYLQINDFRQRLRAKQSKFPLPSDDRHMTDIRPSHDRHMTVTCRPELEVEEEEKKKDVCDVPDYMKKPDIKPFQAPETFPSGKEAFEQIMSDSRYIENLLLAVSAGGYKTCTKKTLSAAIRSFISREATNDDFPQRPKNEVKRHLTNWINMNIKKLPEYAIAS